MGTGIDDELLLSLLQCCGSVVKWKRTTDPVTGESKAFGFCDYSTGELTLTRTLSLSLSLSLSLTLTLLQLELDVPRRRALELGRTQRAQRPLVDRVAAAPPLDPAGGEPVLQVG